MARSKRRHSAQPQPRLYWTWRVDLVHCVELHGYIEDVEAAQKHAAMKGYPETLTCGRIAAPRAEKEVKKYIYQQKFGPIRTFIHTPKPHEDTGRED